MPPRAPRLGETAAHQVTDRQQRDVPPGLVCPERVHPVGGLPHELRRDQHRGGRDQVDVELRGLERGLRLVRLRDHRPPTSRVGDLCGRASGRIRRRHLSSSAHFVATGLLRGTRTGRRVTESGGLPADETPPSHSSSKAAGWNLSVRAFSGTMRTLSSGNPSGFSAVISPRICTFAPSTAVRCCNTSSDTLFQSRLYRSGLSSTAPKKRTCSGRGGTGGAGTARAAWAETAEAVSSSRTGTVTAGRVAELSAATT